MASSKLSELTVATGATSSDLLYIVQSGSGKRISFTSLVNSIRTLLGTTSVLVNSGFKVELTSSGSLMLSTEGSVHSMDTSLTLMASVGDINVTTTTADIGTTSVAFLTSSNPRLDYFYEEFNSGETNWWVTSPALVGVAGVVSVVRDGVYTIVTLNQPVTAQFETYKFQTDPHEWVFGADGGLTFPHGMVVGLSAGQIVAALGKSVSLISNNKQQYVIVDDNTVTITAGAAEWLFDHSGLMSIPDSSALVPLTSTSSGAKGSVVWDSNYIYMCVDTNTWKRASLNSW